MTGTTVGVGESTCQGSAPQMSDVGSRDAADVELGASPAGDKKAYSNPLADTGSPLVRPDAHITYIVSPQPADLADSPSYCCARAAFQERVIRDGGRFRGSSIRDRECSFTRVDVSVEVRSACGPRSSAWARSYTSRPST